MKRWRSVLGLGLGLMLGISTDALASDWKYVFVGSDKLVTMDLGPFGTEAQCNALAYQASYGLAASRCWPVPTAGPFWRFIGTGAERIHASVHGPFADRATCEAVRGDIVYHVGGFFGVPWAVIDVLGTDCWMDAGE